ncbi:MAG: kinase/pyrophosphorylase [candidate division Zixibacteria bacterium]|nr:kinase/pyrophosphorylase [candidate division Zixibacteria bacterium]
MGEEKKIVIISDGTGKTAKRLMDAVLAQYSQKDVGFSLVSIYAEVRDKRTLAGIFRRLDIEYLVVYSIISENLSAYCHEKLTEKSILHLNILEPMVTTMSKFLGVHPDFRPGILQIIDDRYYKKVDAIGYTVEHDDGRGPMIQDADVVLVGLSRTCKTPISMFLSCNYGLKVSNIPIIPDPTMEKNFLSRLELVPQDHIYGLIMQPDALAQAREERAFFLARTSTFQDDLQKYYDLKIIREELKFCRDLYHREKWRTIDVTRRAIEEVSQEILHLAGFSNGR